VPLKFGSGSNSLKLYDKEAPVAGTPLAATGAHVNRLTDAA
jgi:hypothetical protein